MKRNIKIWVLLILSLIVTNVYADDFTINSLELLPKTTQKINILLNNESEISTAFQFDLVLPKGISILKDNNGKLIANLNGSRAKNHQLYLAEIEANTYRFIAYSTSNSLISGTKGDMVQLELMTDKDIVPETKTIGLKSMSLVEADGTQHVLKDQTVKVNVLEAEMASITIGGKGFTTYISKKNLDFSGMGDEVKAYIATGYDYDNGTIWLTRVKDVPAGTPLIVKGVASETYEIPIRASSGCYYKNMLVGNLSGETKTIGGTTAGMTDYYLKNGSFLSADGTNTINNGKAYLQIPTTPPAATAGSSQSVKLNDYGFASFCGSQDLDFTNVEGLKAFAVTGYDDANGTIWLTRVKRVSAKTPLLLTGGSGASYSVPSEAVGSYYANMMKGNLSGSTITIFTTEGDMTNYYLKGNQLLKATDKGNTIGNGKAYMQIPTKHVTRSMEDFVDNLIYGISGDEPEVISIPVVNTRGLDGDGTTGIHSIENGELDNENDVYYNLQGQRVENPAKGVYLKNGRKVVIK